MIDTTYQIDLNTATLVELKNLPGIGAALARKILANRPYASVDDLGRVSGLGKSVLDQIRPYITVVSDAVTPVLAEMAPAMPVDLPVVAVVLPDDGQEMEPAPDLQPAYSEPVASQPEPVVVAWNAVEEIQPEPVEPQPSAEPAFLEESTTTPEAEQPAAAPYAPSEPVAPPVNPRPGREEQLRRPVSLLDATYIAAASGVISFILAVGFILLLLVIVNGGLRFVRPFELQSLAGQVDALSTQTGDLQQNVDGIASRMDELGGLAGQVDELGGSVSALDGRLTSAEQDDRQLREDVDAAAESLGKINSQVDEINLQVDALITRTARFQKFLDGLGELLNTLAQPVTP